MKNDFIRNNYKILKNLSYSLSNSVDFLNERKWKREMEWSVIGFNLLWLEFNKNNLFGGDFSVAI